jgi:signal transduction histidine kinase
LTQLIDDLLDVSRIQAGRLNYNFEKMNFAEMFNEVVEAYSQQMALTNTEVKSYVDAKLEGYWDRSRLEQVMVNLLSNALKYAPGSPVVVFAKRDGDFAVVTVQDFGPGIPEHQRAKMFGRFERLGQNRNIGGLGLGLFISRQIILAHKGSLELKPGSSIGTTFMFRIPLDSRDKEKPEDMETF